MALLLAGFPVEVAGQTVNRLCGSGLQAINAAAHAIAVGDGDVFIAGGVESMTRAPVRHAQAREPPVTAARARWPTRPSAGASSTRASPSAHYPYSMGETAENVAERWRRLARAPGRVRARSSQQRARRGHRGRPVRRPRSSPSASRSARATRVVVDRDEHPRADTTLEALARTPPGLPARAAPSRPATRSGINDGAAAVLLVEADASARRSACAARPRRRARPSPASTRRAWASARSRRRARRSHAPGSPSRTSTSSSSTRRSRPSRSPASTSSGSTRARVNVNGGAIALGHPLGMSGGAPHHDAGPRAAPDAAAATAWRRCASASGRASRRSSSASTPEFSYAGCSRASIVRAPARP